jgi:hypothetical protein
MDLPYGLLCGHETAGSIRRDEDVTPHRHRCNFGLIELRALAAMRRPVSALPVKRPGPRAG